MWSQFCTRPTCYSKGRWRKSGPIPVSSTFTWADRERGGMGLLVTGLNQHYGSSHTLKNIAFQTGDRACMAVLGRNGSGKTTLMKCIMGLLEASSGTIVYDGKIITNAAPHERVHAGLGYVPQGREIFANLTVAENLQ